MKTIGFLLQLTNEKKVGNFNSMIGSVQSFLNSLITTEKRVCFEEEDFRLNTKLTKEPH